MNRGRQVGTRDSREHARFADVRRAALELFYLNGFEHTRMQEIADRVGIVKAGLYYYFNSKEALLYDLILEAHQKALESAASSDPGNKIGSTERLVSFIRGALAYQTEFAPIASLYSAEARSLSQEHRAEIVVLRDQYDSHLREILKAGRESGEFRSDLDIELTSIAIESMINSLYRWYKRDLPDGLSRIMDAFTSLILSGVVPVTKASREPASTRGRTPGPA